MTANPRFLFVCCQAGAETVCKQEIQGRHAGLRPAFSRPGFVTFKADPSIQPGSFQLVSTFARTWGWSLGKITGEESGEMARQVVELAERADVMPHSGTGTDEAAAGQAPSGSQTSGENRENVGDWAPISLVHAWQRDLRVPGEQGFEPGITPLAELVGKAVAAAATDPLRSRKWDANRRAKPGERVLDVVVVDPQEWWVGWHESKTVAQSWPGGVPLLKVEEAQISRAWLKIHEAVLWGQVPIRPGDVVAEVGSAPGGAAKFLLDRGAVVVAIDPAELDPELNGHPRLTHIRRRAKDVPRRDLADIRWLVADINMPPNYTLDVVEDYVSSPHLHVRGVIATLKLTDWGLAGEINAWRERVRSLGFADVRTRQLAFNRQEICLVALKNRFERRLSRGKGSSTVGKPTVEADSANKLEVESVETPHQGPLPEAIPDPVDGDPSGI